MFKETQGHTNAVQAVPLVCDILPRGNVNSKWLSRDTVMRSWLDDHYRNSDGLSWAPEVVYCGRNTMSDKDFVNLGETGQVWVLAWS